MRKIMNLKDYKYVRCQQLAHNDFRFLRPGNIIWIYYAKDDNPEYVRFDEPHIVASVHKNHFTTESGDEWEFNGDTSRGYAYYFFVMRSDNGKKVYKV